MVQVTAKQNKQPSRCGYLYKYRPFTTGLFSNTWELRFFTLNGSALQYYKSEKDTTMHPRGYVDVAASFLFTCTPAWTALPSACSSMLRSRYRKFLRSSMCLPEVRLAMGIGGAAFALPLAIVHALMDCRGA